MAYSYVKYTGNGSTTTYSIPFTYISKDYLEVKVNNVLTTAYTLPTASTLAFTVAPPNTQAVEIRRNTPKTARLVDFQDASILTEAALDLDSDQAFHITQETYDLAIDGVGQAVTDAAASSAANASAAAASYDSFDDRYLGAKASAPTLDNDGAALLEGALYWNTVGKTFWAWNGSAWASFTVNAQPIDDQLTTLAGISAQQATDFTTLSAFVGGLLNDIDAATFRSSIGANAGTVTSVSGTAPIVSSGGATPAISIPAATASVAGHMTAAQAAKLAGITAGSSVMVFKSLGSADGFTEYMDTYASYSTFSSAAVRVPFACSLKNMFCVAKDVATTPTFYEYRLYKNGVAQTFISTTGSGLTQSSNTADTVTCVAGDLISVAVYCNLTGTTVAHHVSLEVIKS